MAARPRAAGARVHRGRRLRPRARAADLRARRPPARPTTCAPSSTARTRCRPTTWPTACARGRPPTPAASPAAPASALVVGPDDGSASSRAVASARRRRPRGACQRRKHARAALRVVRCEVGRRRRAGHAHRGRRRRLRPRAMPPQRRPSRTASRTAWPAPAVSARLAVGAGRRHPRDPHRPGGAGHYDTEARRHEHLRPPRRRLPAGARGNGRSARRATRHPRGRHRPKRQGGPRPGPRSFSPTSSCSTSTCRRWAA